MDRAAIAEALQELHTLSDMVRWGASQFAKAGLHFGHGTDNAWDESAALVLHVLHLPPDIHPQAYNTRLTLSERQAITRLVQQRIEKRLPLPYLTHEAWFAGLPFYIDERVIIPRSPIAELIEPRFHPWLDVPGEHILDLCTGSGCIAIASAMAFPEAEQIDAVDISDSALAVAEINVKRHQMENRINLLKSDLFDAVPQKQYDLIISNPPYVDAQDLANLPKEFLHEPTLALAGGDDGLDLVVRILQQAKKYLKPIGVLAVEVGNSRAALEKRFPDLPFIWPDFEHGGHGVFVLMGRDLK